MIKINKGPAPEYLNSDKMRIARKRLAENVENSGRQERLRFETNLLLPVKGELLRLSGNKCAYCESILGVISTGDIENFRPKAGAKGFNKEEYAPMHYWWLAYSWDNLFVACQICNQKYKRDYFPLEQEQFRCRIGATDTELMMEQALLIDPCLDNPGEHLAFEENGYVNELSKKGKVTIEILGLNRTELVDRRRKEADQLKDKLEIMRFTTDLSNRFTKDFTAYIKELYADMPAQEYVALQRTVFENWYEQNSALWEEAKKRQNDNTKTRRTQKADKTGFSKIADEISEVDIMLTSLKRFSIKSVTIENFKSIENLTLQVKPVKDERESWLLLLGDNGIGKSSILQAIALALTTKKQLARLELDVQDYLRKDAESGMVILQSFEHDKPVVLHFDKNGFRTELEEAVTFVLGYGSTRLLPKGKIQPDTMREPYLNVKNLFDYSVALNDPNIWLAEIDDIEFRDRVAPAFFDVLALRGEDRLWIKDGRINIHQFGADHELEDNSDGYKTITALVADIMQTLSIDKANYHNAQGIVLVDEIGNHLHPRWRMKIVAALRKAFPRLQFFVTTHEPLCLRGLAHGEVAVLVRDQNNSIKAIESDLLPDHNLMRIDQLLTSDLFGLINILDEDTEKTYEEYYALLSKRDGEKTPEDNTKIAALSAELSEKEMLGSTPGEQILYRLINETYARKLREEGFKTKEVLKTETIDEVKSILKEKKLDWL
jgi:uncharacterized protein (TIGR02646 family)